jgi:hypothetical protein
LGKVHGFKERPLAVVAHAKETLYR